MKLSSLLIACFAAVVALGALWANPRRATNRACATVLSLITVIFFCIYRAIVAGEYYATIPSRIPLDWIRAHTAATAFLPFALWLLKSSVLRTPPRAGARRRQGALWALFGLGACGAVFSDAFIPGWSRPGNLAPRGPLYYALTLGTALALLTLGFGARKEIRSSSGVSKLELYVIVVVFSLGAAAALILSALGNAFSLPALRPLAFWVSFAAVAMTAWALTIPGIIDLHETLAVLAQRGVLFFATAAAIVGGSGVLEPVCAAPLNVIVAAVVILPFAFALDTTWRRRLKLGGIKPREALRARLIGAAKHEGSRVELVHRFEALLREHFQCDTALLLLPQSGGFSGGAVVLLSETRALAALGTIGWVTPERLQRSRARPDTADLAAVMEAHRLGVLVAAPHGAAVPALIVCLGVKAHEAPYTYPEIERLQNVAELMDNILTRAQLSEQAALRARMEHLAMMSRGLAHDLKNLITPVSSFLVHFDGRYPAGSAEAEVHAAARRSVRIMTDYVREAMFFAERLEPRFELIELAPILRAVVELTAARAARRGVEVAVDAAGAEPLVADRVLLQRLLANLVANAIDASGRGQRVTLSAAAAPAGWLRLQIADQGCGIAREHLAQIFEPYFTTKEFGEEVRGFGLGLTISQKIVQLHHGAITVQSELGQGSVFTVDLPRAQKNTPARARADAAAA